MYFELAVDAVYPVAEGLTTTVLTVVNNFGCFIFMVLPIVGIGAYVHDSVVINAFAVLMFVFRHLNICDTDIGDWVNYSVGGACILSVIMMVLFKGRLKRSDDDDADKKV